MALSITFAVMTCATKFKKKMYIFYKSYFLKVLKGKKEIVKNDIILESLQM